MLDKYQHNEKVSQNKWGQIFTFHYQCTNSFKLSYYVNSEDLNPIVFKSITYIKILSLILFCKFFT
jgi:hypothetical protein